MEHKPLLPSSTHDVTEKKSARKHKLIIYSSIILLVLVISVFLMSNSYDFRTLSIKSDIRGGDDAPGTDYPWIASWRNKYGWHCCTGSLINQDPPIILTSAHCISSCGNKFGVDLGRTLTQEPIDIYDHFDINYIIPHKSYDAYSNKYDIAMVVLGGTTNRDTIELVPPKPNKRDIFPPDTPIDIMGYGAINQRDTIIAESLQVAKIQYWTKTDCTKQIADNCGYEYFWDEELMFCGWDPKESTEGGDSGGPGLMNELLAGVNSWSPGKCSDNRIVDVFVDIGSVRNWIEDNKPTKEIYILGLHICNNTNDGVSSKNVDDFSVILHGSNGDSVTIPLSAKTTDLDNIFEIDGFNVFKFEINNIGWKIQKVTILSDFGKVTDSLCIDFMVSGRMDSPQLFAGRSQGIWIDGKAKELELYNYCGSDRNILNYIQSDDKTKDKKKGGIGDNSVGIDEYYYTLIIHVCDETFADSVDKLYVRLQGSYDNTEWFELENNAMDSTTFEINGVYIFSINTGGIDIGSDIDSIEFQSVGDDEICIDMISVGKAYNPYFWKGNNRQFWFGNPCLNPVAMDRCYQYYSVPLVCYR